MYIVNLPKLQNKEKHMDHFHLLFVTLLIFQESKKTFPRKYYYTSTTSMKNMKDIRKKADVKSAAIGKDRYKCHRYINRIHYNIQTRNIYGQNGGSIFDNCSTIFFKIVSIYRVSCYLSIDLRFNFYDYVSQHQHDFL